MRVMKQLVAVALALCSLMAACTNKDPETAQKWPRAVEPRLTGLPDWRPCTRSLPDGNVVEQAVCGRSHCRRSNAETWC